MQIRVLGCSGSIAAGSRTTSFLLDESILVDAGTGVGDLTLDELVRIEHILISHSHLDHVLSIGLLADSVARRRGHALRPPVQVHALPETLHALRRHIFNGVIWPDFTRLPTRDKPVLAFVPFAVGDTLTLGTRQLEVLPAAHTVPAVGFAAHGSAGSWVYTGDTGPNPALWQRLSAMTVHTLVIETAFCDDERAVAAISRHLHPAQLKLELQQFAQPCNVYITHIKPGEVESVMSEVAAIGGPHHVQALQTGQLLHLPG